MLSKISPTARLISFPAGPHEQLAPEMTASPQLFRFQDIIRGFAFDDDSQAADNNASSELLLQASSSRAKDDAMRHISDQFAVQIKVTLVFT